MPPAPIGEAKPAQKRGTRLPDDFAVTPDMVAWARERVPHVDGRHETEKFINHWRGKSGKDATKLDWQATWRNWMLRASERAGPRTATGQQTVNGMVLNDRTVADLQRTERMAALDAAGQHPGIEGRTP